MPAVSANLLACLTQFLPRRDALALMVPTILDVVLLLLFAGFLVRLCKRLAGTELGEVLLETALGLALFGLVFTLYR